MATQQTLTSINPTTGLVLETYPALNAEGIQATIELAGNAWLKWRETRLNLRTKMMMEVAAELREQQQALAEMMAMEMGKPITQGLAEVEQAAECCEHYAEHAQGYLESDTAELGSFLAAGGICATVIQLDPMKLVGYVPETEVGRLAMGASARARLADGGEAEGEVTFISRSGDPVTRTFAVEVEVDNADLAIRDGQTAEIYVSAPGTLAHRLPQSALTLNNDGKLGVRVVDWEGIVQFMPVKILRDDIAGIWVTGLTEEADVIVVGQDFVTAGLKVAVTYEAESDGEDQP